MTPEQQQAREKRKELVERVTHALGLVSSDADQQQAHEADQWIDAHLAQLYRVMWALIIGGAALFVLWVILILTGVSKP